MNIDPDLSSYSSPDQVARLFLPLAATIEADHFRVFLAACEEDGISLQKLARITGLRLSEVIRATSSLQAWQELDSEGDGLLNCGSRIGKGYRKQMFLTKQGHKLRNVLIAVFNKQTYTEMSFNLHQVFQQALSENLLAQAA